MNFIHIPKTGGTSIYVTLGIEEPGHKKLLKYIPNTFTVVRNPFDRLVSHFFYIKTKNSYYYKEHPNFKELEKGNFDDYIYLCKQDSKFYLEPQSYYVCDKDDNILVDHVLRHETLQEDFNKFWDLKLPHLNKSDRDKDWEKYYNENTIKTVYEFYKRDFINFNYDTRTKRLG